MPKRDKTRIKREELGAIHRESHVHEKYRMLPDARFLATPSA